jgi:predicted metal-dependent hydrolase
MNMVVKETLHTKNYMVVRESLDFKLDDSIPKYWFNNDPFLSLLVDGICASFPEGERFFICSERPFKDQIKDPILAQELNDFIHQEGQHGIVHTEFNQILIKQGLPIESLLIFQKKIFAWQLSHFSPKFNLAITAACEHITALMAECFFARKEMMENADYRVRAMLAWHSIEELEHKAVAYDLMNALKISYAMRTLAMLYVTIYCMKESMSQMSQFLKSDGFSFGERSWIMLRGMFSVFGRKGLFAPMAMHWFCYFRPNFHPWQSPPIDQHQVWINTFAQTGDPIAAGEAFHQAGK